MNLIKAPLFHVVLGFASLIASPAFGALESPVIGSMNVDVSVNQGKAAASVPFSLPSGIHDLTPALGIQYQQSAGNGLAGPGWELSGSAVIAICTPTIDLDGFYSGLDGSRENTRYCLNGQRLILNSGNHGYSGATYVLEHDNNSLFTISGVTSGYPTSWIHQDGAGYKFTYERVSASEGASVNWLLTVKEDFFGNRIDYTYSGSAINPSLDSIEYSGYQVEFNYRNRSTAFTLYQNGETITQDELLDSVTVKNGTQFLFKYVLSYENVYTLYGDLAFDRLASITKCYDSAENSCLTPTEFDYEELPTYHTAQDSFSDRTTVIDISEYADSNGTSSRYDRPSYRSADVDNDGTPDFCYYKPGTGVACALGELNAASGTVSYGSPVKWGNNLGYGKNTEDFGYYSALQLLDLNSDGFVDYCIPDDNGIRCAFNSKSGSFLNASYLQNIPFTSDSNYVFETVNQDRILDICGFNDSGTYICYEGKESGGFNSTQLLISEYAKSHKADTEWTYTYCDDDECEDTEYFEESSPLFAPIWIDVDGDLNSDLCWVDKSASFTCQFGSINSSSKTKTLSAPVSLVSDLPVKDFPTSPGDIEHRWPFESDDYQEEVDDVIDYNIKFSMTVRIADLNADGLPDFCYEKSNNINCHLNTGDASNLFQAGTVWLDYAARIATLTATNLDGYDSYQGYAMQLRATLDIKDTNFDGLADICYVDTDEVQYCALNELTEFGEPYARQTLAAPMDMDKAGSGSYYENFVRAIFGMKTKVKRVVRSSSIGTTVQVTDLNGDGKGEYCYRGLYGVSCTSMREAAPLSLLTGITDGLGVKTEISYSNMLTGNLYLPAESIYGDFIERPVDQLVVSSITTGNGVYSSGQSTEQTNSIEYLYQGSLYNPVTDVYGFEAVHTISTATNSKEVAYYNLDENFEGLLKEKVNYLEGSVVSREVNHHSLVENSQNSSYRIQLDKSVSETYAGSSVISSSETVYSGYDSYGNPGSVKLTKEQGSESLITTTSTTYLNDVSRWLLSRADYQTVTHQYLGETITREVDFVYENGLLSKEIVEPNDSNKLEMLFEYDSAGNVWQKQVKGLKNDSTQQTRTEHFTFDAKGRVLTSTNSIGQTSSFEYDSKCPGVYKATDIAGKSVTTYYDDACRVESTVDPMGNVTTQDYNWSVEQNSNTSAPDAYWNRILYETTTNNPDGTFSTNYFDSHMRAVRTKSSGFNDASNIRYVVADVMYNELGQKYGETAPYSETNGLLDVYNQNWTTYGYDSKGRIEKIYRTAADGSAQTVTNSYWENYGGYALVQQTQFSDYTKEVATNIFGQNAYVTENGLTVSFNYDAIGDLTSTTVGDLVTTIEYDGLGNKEKQIDPSMGTWSYRHNAFGELYWQQDAKGQTVTFDYDQLGRMVSRTESEGTTTWSFYQSGNGIGQVEEEISPEAERYYSYNSYGGVKDVTLVIDDQTFVTAYEYDSLGRLEMTTQPDGLRQKYAYDSTGQVQRVSIPNEDFTAIELDDLVAEKDALLEVLVALQIRIDTLEAQAAKHEASAVYYYMMASDNSDRADDITKGQQALLDAAAAHKEAAEKYRTAAAEQRDKAEATTSNKGTSDFKYQGKQGDSYVFEKSYCYKYRKIFGVKINCKKRKYLTQEFVDSELNQVDLNDGSVSYKSYVHSGSSVLSKVKPYEVYMDAAEQFEALAEAREQAATSSEAIAEQTTEEIPLPVTLYKDTFVPVSISPVVLIPVTISYIEYQMTEVSVEEAVAYYQAESTRYQNLANAQTDLKNEVIGDLTPLYEDWTAAQASWDALNSTLAAYGLDTDTLDGAYDFLDESQSYNGDVVVWMATLRSPSGMLQSELFGNGLFTARDINSATGLVESIATGTYSGDVLREIQYIYNDRGQIISKFDDAANNNDTTEDFYYDLQGRIEDWTFSQEVVLDESVQYHDMQRSYDYDSYGNLTYKSHSVDNGYSEVHDLEYSSSNNRLTSRTENGSNFSYLYDANGNMTSGDGRSYSWNSFNKLSSAQYGVSSVEFKYDANHSRVKKVSGNEVTYYVGGGYEMTIQTTGSERLVTSRHNIFSGHDVVATIEKSHTESVGSELVLEQKQDEVAYYHRDIIGSGDIVTNSEMDIISRQFFTPYGESIEELLLEAKEDATIESELELNVTETYKQELFGEVDVSSDFTLLAETLFEASDSNIKLRGYTSHEHVDELNLVNMNARLYDSAIGRFISADTVIPDAANPLAYNRYMYVYGNPVSYRDPDGHHPIFWAAAFFVGAHLTDNEFLQQVSTVALAITTGQVYSGAIGGGVIGAGAAGGFTSLTVSFAKTGQINKDSLEAAGWAALTAGVAHGIGHGELSPFKEKGALEGWKWAAHASTQGLIEHARGGRFVGGFASGLVGELSGNATRNWRGNSALDVFGRTGVAATLGGISSVALGGDFLNGAITATVVHLYNAESSVTIGAKKQFRGFFKALVGTGGITINDKGEVSFAGGVGLEEVAFEIADDGSVSISAGPVGFSGQMMGHLEGIALSLSPVTFGFSNVPGGRTGDFKVGWSFGTSGPLGVTYQYSHEFNMTDLIRARLKFADDAWIRAMQRCAYFKPSCPIN